MRQPTECSEQQLAEGQKEALRSVSTVLGGSGFRTCAATLSLRGSSLCQLLTPALMLSQLEDWTQASTVESGDIHGVRALPPLVLWISVMSQYRIFPALLLFCLAKGLHPSRSLNIPWTEGRLVVGGTAARAAGHRVPNSVHSGCSCECRHASCGPQVT